MKIFGAANVSQFAKSKAEGRRNDFPLCKGFLFGNPGRLAIFVPMIDSAWIQEYFGTDVKAALLVILNLIIVEGLLSIDNAAVLATMVMDLPTQQRNRALRIGLVLGYVFRASCLFLASFLIQFWWLKLIGALYLLYLAIDFFFTKSTPDKGDDLLNKNERFPYKWLIRFMAPFWATVLMVETMDIVFSIDNVFAAVAYTDKKGLIIAGVFIGILCMRFIAGIFVKVMEKHPQLESSAFIVLALLGLKLVAKALCHLPFFAESALAQAMESEWMDYGFSALTILVFLFPILLNWLRPSSKSKED